jgi:hypothetical protein
VAREVTTLRPPNAAAEPRQGGRDGDHLHEREDEEPHKATIEFHGTVERLVAMPTHAWNE